MYETDDSESEAEQILCDIRDKGTLVQVGRTCVLHMSNQTYLWKKNLESTSLLFSVRFMLNSNTIAFKELK